jgi:hypothetical protein
VKPFLKPNTQLGPVALLMEKIVRANLNFGFDKVIMFSAALAMSLGKI